MSQATAYEQYMLELINRDRAQNGGLPPLAFNLNLNSAAIGHTDWMIANNVFSHTGVNGTDPGTRMSNAGYAFSGTWGWGENIAWATTSASLQADVAQLETNLMNSPPHRANLLNASFKEVGLGINTGAFQGQTSAAVVTQDFAYSSGSSFLTGVAYNDLNGNKFYDVGEGLAHVTVTAVNAATGQSFTTQANDAGGYQLQLAAGTYHVTFSDGGAHTAGTVDETVGAQNVEADWVNPATASAPPPTPSAPPSDEFLDAGRSDILIENSAGTLAVGEVGANGQESYATIGGLGAEWSLHGAGDFLGDGHAQFLMENTGGAVDVGEVQNGKAVYTTVSGLESEWKIQGAGDFAGDGKAQFLIENSNGSVELGEVSGGHAAYAQVAQLGPEWSFKGSGDFLGKGHDQFLIENSSGAVAVGDVQNGAAHYTTVAGLGSEWKFVGAGDFLGDGKAGFLIENASGAVEVGEVGANGQASFTAVAGLGPEWTIKGAGDFLGEGHDQFVMQNTNGAVEVADAQNGKAHFTPVGALGSEWAFHM
jgi:hypothetical protein